MAQHKRAPRKLINSPEKPLTEAAIVSATLDFSNGATFQLEDERAPGMEAIKGPATALESIPLQQETIRNSLIRVMTEPGRLAEEVCRGQASFNATVRAHRIVNPITNGLTITYYEMFHWVFSVAKQGLLILLDPARGFGKKLCRCQYSKCGKFFLAIQPKGGGRPQTIYCGEQSRDDDGELKSHLHLGHKERGARRMRKLRATPKRRGNTK